MMADPPQQTPPDPRPAPPLRGTRDLFDINILPDRFRRKRLSLANVLPWLILVVLLGTIYPTWQLASQAQTTFQGQRLSLAQIQAEFDLYQTNTQEQEDLQAQIDSALAQKEALIESYGGLEFSTVPWSPTLYQINQVLPGGVSWSQIAQRDQSIQLEGVSPEYMLVIDLMNSLRGVEGLESVEINSIEVIDPEAFSTPSEETGAAPTIYKFSIVALTTEEVLP